MPEEILSLATELNTTLLTANTAVVTAPPGAGKSTVLPLTLLRDLDERGERGTIIMLEPRRLAARQIATRMASTLGEDVGQRIGYRVRFESRVSERTRIEVVTEGILSRRLIADPTLDGVAVVIFDEYHERSLASDEALALTREVQSLVRPDLRIVVMSATIDTTTICAALHAPLLESKSRCYDVELTRANEAVISENSTAREIAVAVAEAVRRAHHERQGDILAFLPGQGEITICMDILTGTLSDTLVLPLYGLLSPAEQQRAITPDGTGRRRVVLATPIAETSLTIEGVRIVVDSGLCRTLVYEPRTGLSRLATTRISRDMATQRAGRAGRLGPGTCYRLWTLATEQRMAETRTPEILTADLASLCLDLAAWGSADAAALPWVTPPPAAAAARARNLLRLMDAVDDKGAITQTGRNMAVMPCHPRLAHMLTLATDEESRHLAADIAAILEEKDPLAATTEDDADIDTRLSIMREGSVGAARTWGRIRQSAAQYYRLCRRKPERSALSPSSGILLAAAYPERVAKAEDGTGAYRMASGDKASLPMSDALTAHEWLAVADVHTTGRSGRIFLAAPLTAEEVLRLATHCDTIAWDTRQGRVRAEREARIGALTISSKPLHDVPRADIIKVISEAAVKDGATMFNLADDAFLSLQRRLEIVGIWHPELQLPPYSTDALLCSAEEWLPLYAPKATSVAELRRVSMRDVLWGTLPYDIQTLVEHLAPTHITVPTGSRIRIDYRQGQTTPVVSVRLQECFGMKDTPLVDDGRRPVLLELLSPGYKPVQLTSDLASFWQSTYFEVRSELRRRYPKHSWPDEPTVAEPVRGVKRRGQGKMTH